MQDGRPHPLLAKIPLTVSPFISLPTATTLPYTYKALPSTLPASSTGEFNGSAKPKYVVSSSGHAAHPDEILASCHALQSHLQKLQDDAEEALKEWEDSIKNRELAEKRRVAPGWLDREEKILEPEKKHASLLGQQSTLSVNDQSSNPLESQSETASPGHELKTSEGDELDRAFGGMGMR
ncbi:hypothetical protein MMC20_001005 [Loxospora ochrophaea]|nr:hypothetical protein [Loxospora ochrophaea]